MKKVGVERVDVNSIIGTKSGMLTAVDVFETKRGKKIKCKCDCGNEKIVDAKSFKYRKVRSCGCLYSKSKIKDIAGKKFGKLLVEKFTGEIKHHSSVWRCKCECGGIINVKANDLSSGAVKSCGCLRSEVRVQDLLGRRFGKLIPVEKKGKKHNNSQLWLCRCDCGKYVEVSAKNLTSGRTNSCGCLLDKARKKAISKALISRQEKYVEGTDLYQLAQEPRVNNTSGVVGVTYDKTTKTWKAKIQFKKKKYYLGSSKDINIAIQMRKEAEEKLHGEFLKWYEEHKNK
ncbi:MAG: hypothetical protein N4A76_12600 [Firmicutes bacterium]|jgi:hypothetical protein|nr:hypothetical protein [Bacillota bacterium]